MTNASARAKSMTIGEATLFPLFAVLAFLCLVAAAMAHDAPFAFHASLGSVASIFAAFAILNRYYERPAELPPQEINGRPNYNFGPIKFASVAAMVWGIAGFAAGLIIASQLAWPVLNFDLPWTTFGRLRPLHTSAVIFAFGGNVLIASSFYVVQKTCPARGRSRALVRGLGIQLLHCHRRHGLFARSHAEQGICRARVVCRP